MGATAIALAAGLAALTAAFQRGDLDEVARQGQLAGPQVVELALASPDRATRLAAIAAAPTVEDRAELLDALALAAAGPDRRVAIPAAAAARTIAGQLARGIARGDAIPALASGGGGAGAQDLPPADDLAPDDLARWRTAFAHLATDAARPIELRVLALDTASALAPDGAGVPLDTALADPDPALRLAAIAGVAVPVPGELRAALAKAVVSDTQPLVALAAGAVLCADLAQDPAPPVLAALGDPGLARLATAVDTPGAPRAQLAAVARCFAADGSPQSAAALRAIKKRTR